MEHATEKLISVRHYCFVAGVLDHSAKATGRRSGL